MAIEQQGIQSVLAHLQQEISQRQTGAQTAPLVITFSRQHGADGSHIAALLAKTLDIRLHHHDLLRDLAAVCGLPRAEQQSPMRRWLHDRICSLVFGPGGEADELRQRLIDKVRSYRHQDCVIVGRGAHLILADWPVFRVRIIGTSRRRIERLAQAKGLSAEQAGDEIERVDALRDVWLKRLVGQTIPGYQHGHPSNFDLILNTDRLAPDAAVAVLLMAVSQYRAGLSGTDA